MHTREIGKIAAKLTTFITDIACTYKALLIQAGLNTAETNRVITALKNTLLYYTENTLNVEQLGEFPQEVFIVTDIINQAKISHENVEIVAQILRKAYNTFQCRLDLESRLLGGVLDWRIVARNARNLFKRWDDYEAAAKAATLIQAAYKGYYTRHMVKKLMEQSMEPCEILEMLKTEPTSEPQLVSLMPETVSSVSSSLKDNQCSEEEECNVEEEVNKLTITAILNELLFDVHEIIKEKSITV